MAKEINLGKSAQPTPAQPGQQELLSRVTSRKKMVPPPQPLHKPPGITGDLPLPPGRIVGGIAPSSLTPAEREALEGIGWTEDVPIPPNMAEILEKERLARVAQAEEVILPVDPRTPPLKVETQDINKLKPADRDRLMQTMKEAATQAAQMQQTDSSRAKIAAASPQIPGLADAYRAAEKAGGVRPALAEPVIEDDRPTAPVNMGVPAASTQEPKFEWPHEAQARKAGSNAPAAQAPQAPQAPPQAAPEPPPAASDTGADLHPAFCPHCQWDLSQPDIIEPSYNDKMVFLHALLGQKSYVKEYELFGGNVVASFRTLTTREIDQVYKQAWRDRETGKVLTEVDYWERINRYRLFLQLLGLKSIGADGFIHDLPDGLSRETNPGCTATWNMDNVSLDPSETALPLIEEWLVQNVFKTEAIFRVVNTACNQFNRLVAKLEAMADNSDFWRPTGEQS